jgi:hypothetical protein
MTESEDFLTIAAPYHNLTATQATTKALKFDNEKPRTELVDADAILELAKVLTFGAKKYAANNWRKGIEFSRVIGAALRHIYAIQQGEDRDQETGLLHSAHAMCELMFLTNFYKSHPELDDRYKERQCEART